MQSSADTADQPVPEIRHAPQGNRRAVLHAPVGLMKRRQGHVGFPRYQEQVDIARPPRAHTYQRKRAINGSSGLHARLPSVLPLTTKRPRRLFPVSRVKPMTLRVRGPGVSARIRPSLCRGNAEVPPQTRVPTHSIVVFPDPVDSGRLGSVPVLEAHQAIPPRQTAYASGTRTTFAVP
jgi:hypothetical protein